MFLIDPSLKQVPFASLSDKIDVKYLSDTFRIRIVPSLTKLIQESPADYHSQTCALLVEDPEYITREAKSTFLG